MKKEKTRCPTCGQITEEREINMYRGLVISLWNVFKWCEGRGMHEFKMSDIRHLLGQVNYARFGDWVIFGGLVYKTEKAHYGLNMERCNEFFSGKRTIPARIWKNPITGELKPEDYRTIKDIPHLAQFLDDDRQFVARYREPQMALL